MNSDLLYVLCALAAFLIPMGVAWACVAWSARKNRRRAHAAPGHSRAFK